MEVPIRSNVSPWDCLSGIMKLASSANFSIVLDWPWKPLLRTTMSHLSCGYSISSFDLWRCQRVCYSRSGFTFYNNNSRYAESPSPATQAYTSLERPLEPSFNGERLPSSSIQFTELIYVLREMAINLGLSWRGVSVLEFLKDTDGPTSLTP